MADAIGQAVPDKMGFTYDSMGRPIVSPEEKRRLQALELACSTYVANQVQHDATTKVLLRATAFETYLKGAK